MKTYSNPSITILGSVSEITRAFGNETQSDTGFLPRGTITLTGSTDGILVPCKPGQC